MRESEWERLGYRGLSSQGAESVSAPRNAFSAVLTAPTSILASSSSQKHLQTELRLLLGRHSLVTGALLNALADSQRTTRLDHDAQLYVNVLATAATSRS